MLDRRAGAVLSGDRAEFAATMWSGSRRFVDSQMRVLGHLREVPLASYRLVADWDRYGDLARARDRARYPVDEVAVVAVQERLRFEGADRDDAVETLYATVVRSGERWLLASDSDLEDAGFLSARHLWHFGPIEVARARGALLLGHPCDRSGGLCPGHVRRLTALLATALDRIGDVPGERPAAIVVLVPGTVAELTRMLQATFRVDDFVAFTYFSVDPERDLRFVAPRVVFARDALATRSSGDVVTLLAHELVHVVTRGASGPFVPAFVEEGLAEQVARRGDAGALDFLRTRVAAGAFDGRLPTDHEFFSGGAEGIYQSYQESLSAARFFVARWGFSRLVRFYRRLGEAGPSAGTARFHLDRALRNTIGIGLQRFERAWASSID